MVGAAGSSMALFSDSDSPSMQIMLEMGELSTFRREIVVCWTPSRSVRCRRSKVGVWVVCSESVDILSGSLSKPSSSDRVGLNIGLETSSFVVCSISLLLLLAFGCFFSFGEQKFMSTYSQSSFLTPFRAMFQF